MADDTEKAYCPIVGLRVVFELRPQGHLCEHSLDGSPASVEEGTVRGCPARMGGWCGCDYRHRFGREILE